MKKISIFIFCTLILYMIMPSMFCTKAADYKSYALINKNKLFLEVANTPKKRIKGLMFIKNLPEKHGMIFLFEKSGKKTFWMKNVEIPLDIIFIDKGKIINIINNAKPCRQFPCPTYSSEKNADSAIEVNAGYCNKYKIKIGDEINFIPFHESNK